jgi:MOB kinase activator 1
MGNSKSKAKGPTGAIAPTGIAANVPVKPYEEHKEAEPSTARNHQIQIDDKAQIASIAADGANAPTGEAAYNFWSKSKTKTVRPEKKREGKNGHNSTIKATMKATLGGNNLLAAVKLPPNEDVNEWIAVNTITFYNAASMIYGTCEEFCTPASCPLMNAGHAEYLWKDNDKFKKPTAMSAQQYIQLTLDSIENSINDPTLFPIDENAKFPRHFMSSMKTIYKRLFRMYAHIYCSHADKIRDIGANAHLNTVFKHFIYFALEFSLIDSNEMAPLQKLIDKLRENDEQLEKAEK